MELQVHPNDVPGVPDGAALLRTLREHFAMSGFRPGQLEAIQATLAGQDALVILPTGGGKSVAFQLPCHTRAHGFTVVVCPLLALAKDQVDKCEERGIYAERWNCEVPEPRKASIAKDMVCDEPSLRLLYTTPESLQTPKLLESLKEACANGNLVSFAVDEAHTVSEWGHDFRPAYLQLSAIKQEFPSVPVVALTASATPKVRDDIISVLRLKQPRLIKGSFNRPNIAYQVRHKELLGDGSDNAALEDLVKFIQARSGEGGIVYARLRATCDWLASSLAAHDIDVGCYHAGKNNDVRTRVQRDWSSGGTNVVVATIAFGMGIDRPDVRWVVHWNPPTSMEGFYQESGRAGRDGLPSASLLYASKADLESNQKMERGVRSGAVAEVAGYCHGGGCRRRYVLKFFGEERGPCDRTCDALCDACTDPRAVSRALSRLESREAEVGNRAAQIRAKMLGINVPAPGDGEEEGGEGGGAKGRGGGNKALWASANTYGAAAAAGDSSSDSDSDGDGDAEAREEGAAGGRGGSGSGLQQQGTTAAAGGLLRTVAPPVLRRPPVLKRPMPPPATGAGALGGGSGSGGVRILEDPQGAAAPGNHQQPLSPVMADKALQDDGEEEEVTGPPPPQDGAGQQERRALTPCTDGGPRSAATRQPLLKRPKPCGAVQLPFKAPVRVGPKSCDGAGTGASLPTAGRGSSGAVPTSSSGVQGPEVAMEGEADGGGSGEVATAKPPAQAAGGGVLVMRKRLGFVPPARVGPGKLG
ncbi:hypothetical protein CHLRE_16g673393v5 [Chlamydomonas reinhardtii]|uniref:ATP-dependent DNA helicase n=1 Tax=Chlamydomonas reinhardtii TaxID=3055 RepID=A0A2K3CVR2_CHLRE|nr:uncharacterized protein CHLRE_16g673393v5 [Chlamydomonas reinhardtii]PNW72372.1 hypothetical protein CHLRE_16g673393v5 [Chlamydomonas reinhardtii]